MFTRQRLDELNERAILLTAQADLCRGALRAELTSLRRTWGWVGALGGAFRRRDPLLIAAAVASGAFAAWNWRRVIRWLPALLTGWRWVNTVLAPRERR